MLLVNNQLTLLKHNEIETPRDPTINSQTKIGSPDSWADLLNMYGVYNPGVSQVRLTDEETGNELVGTITVNSTDETKLDINIDIDTKPTNTLPAINAIIDPEKNSTVSAVTSAVAGTRFLILGNIGDIDNLTNSASIWGNLVAKENDIIEFNGTSWSVAFSALNNEDIEYVTNLVTLVQYKWSNGMWAKSYEGEYSTGNWSIVL